MCPGEPRRKPWKGAEHLAESSSRDRDAHCNPLDGQLRLPARPGGAARCTATRLVRQRTGSGLLRPVCYGPRGPPNGTTWRQLGCLANARAGPLSPNGPSVLRLNSPDAQLINWPIFFFFFVNRALEGASVVGGRVPRRAWRWVEGERACPSRNEATSDSFFFKE